MRFSLYVHIPYCQAKCPYCDFNSHAAQRWPEDAYVDAVRRELDAAAQQHWGDDIGTIFFGGGTPSLFAPTSIHSVISTAAALWPLVSGAEVTLEANPGTVSLARLAGFRAAGVNRLSFGVQSFAPHHLRTLGRIHSAEEADDAVTLARAAGFTNINIDLMYALPQQTLAEWETDLERACALGVEHVSAYNLTYEEGTPFYDWRARGRLQPLAEETELAMFNRAHERLGAAGFTHYEISNYAQRGRECRHNLNYWHGGAYLGVGAGAHSFSLAAAPGGLRYSNEKQPTAYIQAIGERGSARVFEESLTPAQARGEFAFLALRCRAGVDAAAFRARFGDEFVATFPHVLTLERDGLLEHTLSHWRLSRRGLQLADSVFATFL